MDVWVVAAVIAFGLLLILVEVFLIPGTTFVGLVGTMVVIAGVVVAYVDHGTKAGNIAFGISAVASGILVYIGFKAYTSRKFSLNDVIDGKVNELEDTEIRPGEKGETITNLRPNGKAIFGDKKIEVYSLGEFIDDRQPIEVAKISGNKIFVKPLNQ